MQASESEPVCRSSAGRVSSEHCVGEGVKLFERSDDLSLPINTPRASARTPVRITGRYTVAMSHGNPFDIDDDAFEVWIVDLDCAGLELIEAARVLNSLDRCDEDNMRAKFA